MRTIRALALLLVVILAFIATPTYALEPLATLLPAELLADSPRLASFSRWVAVDLARFTFLITGCVALTFGVLTSPWSLPGLLPFPHTAAAPTQILSSSKRALHPLRRIGGMLLLIFAILGVATTVVLNGSEIVLSDQGVVAMHAAWIGASLLYLCAAVTLAPRKSDTLAAALPNKERQDTVVPATGWPTLLILLFLALLLYGWGFPTFPAQVDDATVKFGLQAQALVHNTSHLGVSEHGINGTTSPIFFAPVTQLSQPDRPVFTFALAPTALLAGLTRDLLLSTRLVGLLSGLLCTVGIWLLSLELFARRVDPVDDELPIEDNGQSLAVLATMLLFSNIALLYYSRLPLVLTATAWGILGQWALLRGIQRHNRLALALGGLLVGLAIPLHIGAIVFVLTGLLWWIGFGAVARGWLPHYLRSRHVLQVLGASETMPLRVGDFLLWIGGIAIAIAPFASPLSTALSLWFVNATIAWRASLVGFFVGFASPTALYPAPLLNFLLLPLLPLAAGALLFNLDRRQGWLIASWLVSAIGIGVITQSGTYGWDTRVPLLPAIALASAFALDRLRVTLLQVVGRWLQQFITIFLLGLVLWVAFYNGITYYTFVTQHDDTTSTLGHLLRQRTADQQIIVFRTATSDGVAVTGENSTLRFLTNGVSALPTDDIQFLQDLPSNLSSGTAIIVPADETFRLPSIEEAYPDGNYRVVRDHFANPLYYRYTIP